MSDIVNSRIENYLHPKKKFVWREGNRNILSEENIQISEEKKMVGVIEDCYKMVISSNCKVESIQQNGISPSNKAQSPERTNQSASQDAPLDFSVKTVDNWNNVQDSERKATSLVSPQNGSKPYNSENISNSISENKSAGIPQSTRKILSSPVPIYNGRSKFHRTKQRHNASSSEFPTHSPHSSQYYLENLQSIPSTSQDNPMLPNFTMHTQLLNSSLNRQPIQGERSFDTDRPNSQGNSPRLSTDHSPDNMPFTGSILQEVLVGRPGVRSQIPEVNSYLQKMNATSTLPTSSFIGDKPAPSTSTGIPDSSFPSTSTFIPASSPLLPAAGFAYMNGLGFAAASMNGMNSFGNVALLPPSLDSRLPQTIMPGDRKQNKPVRPFKAITNELLFGIPSAAMSLQPINQVLPSKGFFKEYLQTCSKDTDPPKSSPVSKNDSPETSANRAINSSPSCSSNDTESKPDAPGSGDSNSSYQEASTSAVETTAEATSDSKPGNRKRRRSLPEGVKDKAYWEKRDKNNLAAKRSRDARRRKEDMIAQQAWWYRENYVQLQYKMKALEEQDQHRQVQHLATVEQCRNFEQQCRHLELQLRLVADQLAHCKCSARLENGVKKNGFVDSNQNE